MRTIIENGLVYLSEKKSFHLTSLLIEDNLIQDIGDHLSAPQADRIDAKGHFVLPGLIDLHSHLREPGETHKETVQSGTRSAAKGGYTHIVAMANTKPPISTLQSSELIQEIIQKEALVQVTQAGAITDSLSGKTLSPLLMQSCLSVYSDDGRGVSSPSLLKEAFSLAKASDAVIILHEEDANISRNGMIHDGLPGLQSGLPVISSLSESGPILRDLVIAKEMAYQVHFTHISSQSSMEILKTAYALQFPYTADVTPHHLFFSDQMITYADTNYKMKPPIRSESDRRSLIQGLLDGVIQAIATDHAPHSEQEKQLPFAEAPFGVIGFETAFAACYTRLVGEEKIPLETMVPWFTSQPAHILHLDQEGSICKGFPANITIISPEEKVVQKEDFLSKSKNSPFIGKKLRGFPVFTLYQGKVVYETSPNWHRSV